MTPEDWRRILESVDLPTPGAVVDAVADARDLPTDRAEQLLEDALDAEVLVEDADAGTFGVVRVPGDTDTVTDDETTETPTLEGDSPGSNPTPDVDESARTGGVRDFTDPEPGVWAETLLEREQWMGHVEKKPFAPWADADPDDAAPEDSPRWEWGRTENYVDGPTVALAEEDPRLDGRVFLQQDADAFAFVDGDDVRCPETGEVHPEFIRILDALGATYTDVSTSGSGVHANYRGGLPEGVKQADFQIDTEPWGANDDLPSVEFYDGKHVCVATGDHVPGTPRDVRAWDADALESILDEYDQLPEEPTTDREEYDLDGYEPEATGADETTDDIRDVFSALDRLDARRVAGETIVRGWNDNASTSDGKRAFHPSWGGNSNGTANVVDREIWQDTGDRGGYGGPAVMAAIDCPDLTTDERATPRDVRGADWIRAVEHLRDLGYSIPELETPDTAPDHVDDPGDVEHTTVLPSGIRDLTTAASGWDWKHAGREDDTLTVEDARARTVEAIADAYDDPAHSDRVLVEALPTMGKSYGAVKAAADTDEPVTILTGRGRKEQYDQFREWAAEHDLDYYTLPSFTHDCPTATGEHGEEWANTVRGWYNRGATPKEIHKNAEYVLGRPLPCQEHDGQRCPYASKWDFEPADYDLLIGHYYHAHKQKITKGRSVVFDEFPDAYETELNGRLEGAVSYWLETTDGVPFENYTDLIENRDDETRRGEALLWFEDHDVEADETHVFDDESAHAVAPLAVYTILAGEDYGNGWERATFDGGGMGLFTDGRDYYDKEARVFILRPPTLFDAAPSRKPNSVVALDGTPTPKMWDRALGEPLTHRPVLQDGERVEYLQDALNLNLVRTTEYVKPYNNADHVNTERDGALLETIADAHDERPGVITSTTARDTYGEDGLLELERDEYDAPTGGVLDGPADRVKHYGDVLGSNEFTEKRVGAVVGSNHYGDGYIKKWGAYAGEGVDRGEQKGSDLSYSGIGDDILTHMREHETLQAAMRFGRDGNGAVVYVHTDTLPEWVDPDDPDEEGALAGEGRVLKTWSDGMRSVIGALEDLETATTAEVVAHPDVDLSRRQVFKHLETLRDREVLSRRQDPEDGRRVVWRDDDLHRVDEYGDVELGPVDLEDLEDAEVAEVARNSNYTWNFRNREPETDDTPTDRETDPSATVPAATNGGDSTLHDRD